jgi:bacteriocin-like protein
MRKDNIAQRSAEELTTEELSRVTGGDGKNQGPPPPPPVVWGTFPSGSGGGVDRGDFGPAAK